MGFVAVFQRGVLDTQIAGYLQCSRELRKTTADLPPREIMRGGVLAYRKLLGKIDQAWN